MIWPNSSYIASDWPGVQTAFISSLSNWCSRLMPFTSLPQEPASERKQAVKAKSFTGRSASSRVRSMK